MTLMERGEEEREKEKSKSGSIRIAAFDAIRRSLDFILYRVYFVFFLVTDMGEHQESRSKMA